MVLINSFMKHVSIKLHTVGLHWMLSGNLMISMFSSHAAKIETNNSSGLKKNKYARHQYISTNLINPPGHFKGWRISTVWGALCSLKDAKHCTINKEIHHFTTDMLFQKKRYAIISDVMCTHGRGPGECSRYSNSLWNGRLDDGVARDFLFSTPVKTVPVTQRVSYSTGIGALSRG